MNAVPTDASSGDRQQEALEIQGALDDIERDVSALEGITVPITAAVKVVLSEGAIVVEAEGLEVAASLAPPNLVLEALWGNSAGVLLQNQQPGVLQLYHVQALTSTSLEIAATTLSGVGVDLEIGDHSVFLLTTKMSSEPGA